MKMHDYLCRKNSEISQNKKIIFYENFLGITSATWTQKQKSHLKGGFFD